MGGGWGGVGWGVSQHALRQTPPWADTPPPQQMATAVDDMHPTGMHTCYHCRCKWAQWSASQSHIITARKRCLGKGIVFTPVRYSVNRGLPVQGVSPRETPPHGKEWAVHILLECVLVSSHFLVMVGAFF